MSTIGYSAVFPTTAIGSDPALIRDFAQTAEGLGYTHIVAYDHVLNSAAGTGDALFEAREDFHEPLTLLSYLAAVTDRIELITGVLVSPQRQTVLLAKQAAELQILSSGRFNLGISVGWNEVEFEAMGVPMARRGARLDEQVEVIRQLLGKDVVEFSGDFHQIPKVAMSPTPSTPLPIWFGGMSAPQFDRAGRNGDGFIYVGAPTRAGILAHRAAVQERLDVHRPGLAGFGHMALVDFAVGEQALLAEIESWRAAGGTNIGIRAMDVRNAYEERPRNNFTAPQQYIDVLIDFAKIVGMVD